MKDRIIGYTVITAIVLLLVFPASYLIWQASTPRTERTIIFNNVKGLSFLSVQDPVRILGVEVGVVKQVKFKDNAAHVIIETDRDVTFYDGYTVQVLAKGVMGERFLTITTGNPSGRIIPQDKTLRGSVSVGPDEALSYIGLLAKEVHQLKILSSKLRFGSDKNESLIKLTWYITGQIDSVINDLQKIFSAADTSFTNGISTVSEVIEKTGRFTSTVTDSLDRTIKTISTLVENLENLLLRTETLLQQASSLTSKLADPELGIWKHTESSLTAQLTELQAIIKLLDNDSLVLPVRLW